MAGKLYAALKSTRLAHPSMCGDIGCEVCVQGAKAIRDYRELAQKEENEIRNTPNE